MRLRRPNSYPVPMLVSRVLLMAGGALRLIVYFQNRSLFLDEANLARNLAEKSWAGFFQPLDYQQYAPPFFLVLEKGTLLVLGPHELALRFWPLLGGLATLFLFYYLCKRLIDSAVLHPFLLFLIGFSLYFLRYSTEVKQYSTDVATTLALVALALVRPPSRLRMPHLVLWGLAGSISIWFSMPSVFVLAGIGFYYLWESWKTSRFRFFLPWMAVFAFWIANFGVYYATILSTDVVKPDLLSHHEAYFFPLFPKSSHDWSRAAALLLSLFHTATGFTAFSYLTGIGLFFGGVWTLARKQTGLFLLLSGPVVCCLLASGMQLYSLIPRLTLFFVPLLLLIIGVGADAWWRYRAGWSRGILFMMLFALLPLQKGYLYFFQRYEIEELLPVLEYIQQHQYPGDGVFVHHEAVPAFAFYSQHHIDKDQFSPENVYLAEWDETVEVMESRNYRRLWLVFSHLLSEESRNMASRELELASEIGVLAQRHEQEGAAAYLFLLDSEGKAPDHPE